MPNFSILLAPSEGKQSGGNPFAPDMFDYRTSNTFNYFSDLNQERRALIRSLQQSIQAGMDMEPILGVKGEHLEAATQANLEIFEAPLMSALDRYSPGVMYKAMDFAGLPTGAQRRLLENGIIFSGLYGLLRPDDLIANYKLKMDATLPEIGKVSTFWRPHLSEVLNQRLEGRFVWDLLPGAHESAWTDGHTYKQRVRVRFFDTADGALKPVTHQVKPLRGQLVNFIVRDTVESLEPLLEWEHPSGYRYDEAQSTFDDATKSAELAFIKG